MGLGVPSKGESILNRYKVRVNNGSVNNETAAARYNIIGLKATFSGTDEPDDVRHEPLECISEIRRILPLKRME